MVVTIGLGCLIVLYGVCLWVVLLVIWLRLPVLWCFDGKFGPAGLGVFDC